MDNSLLNIIEQIKDTANNAEKLAIQGYGSKLFYGEKLVGKPLLSTSLLGIASYLPSELVITVRAGTKLIEVEQILAEHNQYLAFEPPNFAATSSIGGMIAAGLSGPARVSQGCVRDHLLGLTMIDGRGEVLQFGGQVIKNVAGYDVSRLMVGSLGILGLIAEVSLKVLPRPQITKTVVIERNQQQALHLMAQVSAHPLSLFASCYYQGKIYLRLAGANTAVNSSCTKIISRQGGEIIDSFIAEQFWQNIRQQTHDFFQLNQQNPNLAIWRLSLPSTTENLDNQLLNLDENAEELIEWNGALRWWKTVASAESIREICQKRRGHVTLYRSNNQIFPVFTPLNSVNLRIEKKLKQTFDPHAIFNIGRMYQEF